VQVVEAGSKAQMARELGVSRASLYYHHLIPEKDEALRRQIEEVMEKNPGYGSPRVAIALKVKVNKKRIARVMRKYGLKPARRSFYDWSRPPFAKPLSLSLQAEEMMPR
jgi:HTH-like domain